MRVATSARLRQIVGMGLLLGAWTLASGASHKTDLADLAEASVQGEVATEILDFRLPAQPLGQALQRYGLQTQQPALFRSELVRDRISTAVMGRYAPEAALQLLLQGTGLVAERFQQSGQGGGFVLKEIPPTVASAERPAVPASLDGYPALLQTRVWQALCAGARTAPGAYRALLRFIVDGAGRIQRPQVMGSSGDLDRDTAIQVALSAVHLGLAPPAAMPQPVTMLVLPDTGGTRLRCAQAATLD